MAPHIAVVNDDTTFLRLMQDLLAGEGYRVTLHIEGAGAYEVIREAQPALVVLDIRMEHPEAGWHVADLLRLDPRTVEIPVIICSADVRQLREKAERLRSMRFDVLEKPFDLEELLQKVTAIIGTASG